MYSEEFLERFWAKVEKKGENDCWEWTAAKNEKGYGLIRIEGKNIKAHRVSLQIKINREIGEGLVTKHSCDNRGCVNPQHLTEGTQSENIKEAYERGRISVRKGSEIGNSKLTETEILEIREICKEGLLTQKEIAELYGICSRNVSHIVNRQTWLHI